MGSSFRSLGKLLVLFLLFGPVLLTYVHGRALNPVHGSTWSNTSVSGTAYSVQQTKRQGGLIVAGIGFYGWVMMMDSDGNPLWNNNYHPSGYLDSKFLSVSSSAMRDGGYILAGHAVSIGYTTGSDAWLLKLDRGGNVEWSKTYGGQENDYFLMAEPTHDGGYIAVGNTNLIRCCSSGWIVRTDSVGNIIWQETFVGEDIHSVAVTRDGGFLVTGAVEIGYGNVGLWVFKLDANGQMVWQYAYDISQDSFQVFVASSKAEQTRDGGFIITAFMGPAGLINRPQPRDAMFLRLDSDGRILWQETFGDGIGESEPSSIMETNDGGFIASGFSRPSYFDGRLAGVGGPWLLRLNESGDIVWQRIYSVTGDQLWDAEETKDGGFVGAGFTLDSTWILKTDADGNVRGCALGVLTNMTLVKGDAVVTEPAPATVATPTHATVRDTGVIVTHSPIAQTIQCMLVETGDAGKDN